MVSHQWYLSYDMMKYYKWLRGFVFYICYNRLILKYLSSHIEGGILISMKLIWFSVQTQKGIAYLILNVITWQNAIHEELKMMKHI